MSFYWLTETERYKVGERERERSATHIIAAKIAFVLASTLLCMCSPVDVCAALGGLVTF